MPDFSVDIDKFDSVDFGFELVDTPAPVEVPVTPSTVSVDTTEIDDRLRTIEGKISNILNVVSLNDGIGDLRQVIETQGSTINIAMDQFEQQKQDLKLSYKNKLEEIENLILPLLVNLTKNPEKQYIKWPNRAEAVQVHINKILKVTRGNDN